MTEQPDTNAAIWKSEEVARNFAAQSAQRDRERAEQLTFMARLLPFSGEDAFTFVDLGAGTGAAARAVLTEYPRATAVLAEYSPQMAAEGEKLMTQFAGRFRYVEVDLTTGEWPAEIPTPLDAAIAALSVHHLPDVRKRALFAEIHDRLRPGGWYVNYDPIKAPDSSLEAIWERVNARYPSTGPSPHGHRTPEEQARWENHVRYMIPLAPQLDWLIEAGFQDVDVFWKRLDWVIYGGRRAA
jgi:tRNA (cmo5U34)-methyltransferase